MKKRLLLVGLMSVLLLTGCTHKPKTAEEFKKIANENGIEVYQNTVGLAYAKEAYQTNHEDYNVFFVVGKKAKVLQGVYLDEVVNIQGLAGVKPDTEKTTTNKNGELSIDITTKSNEPEIKPISKTGKNWSHVEIQGKDEYFYVSYIDDTMLYVRCKNEYKDTFKKIIDAMKY
jgi:hypothetical protein